MKTAIIIHGGCENIEEYKDTLYGAPKSRQPWYSWAIRELAISKDILTQTPEMPHPYFTDINFNEWSETLNNFKIDADTILIGHSTGAGFLLKYLSLHPEIKIKQLILVAPWIDPRGKTGDFMNGVLSDLKSLNHIEKIDLFFSTNDDEDMVQESVKQIQAALPKITVHEFPDKGHFCNYDMGNEFPELLEVIK